MSMLRSIGCTLGWHSWEPLVPDVAGAHHSCLYCGKTKKVDTGKPPEAHDRGRDPLVGPSGSVAEDPAQVGVGEDPVGVEAVAHGEELVEPA